MANRRRKQQRQGSPPGDGANDGTSGGGGGGEVVYEGTKLRIEYAMTNDDDRACRAKDYLEALRTGTQEEQVRYGKLLALIRLVGDHHPVSNKKKFKQLPGVVANCGPKGAAKKQCFELKSYQDRVGGYFPGGTTGVFVLAHGFQKQKDRWPKSEIDSLKDQVIEDYDCRF